MTTKTHRISFFQDWLGFLQLLKFHYQAVSLNSQVFNVFFELNLKEFKTFQLFFDSIRVRCATGKRFVYTVGGSYTVSFKTTVLWSDRWCWTSVFIFRWGWCSRWTGFWFLDRSGDLLRVVVCRAVVSRFRCRQVQAANTNNGWFLQLWQMSGDLWRVLSDVKQTNELIGSDF